LSAVELQMSAQFPWSISTGSHMNSLPWFVASQKMRILLFHDLCHFCIVLHNTMHVNGPKRTNCVFVIWFICLPRLFLMFIFFFFVCSHAPSFLGNSVLSHLQKNISSFLAHGKSFEY
jgi:hypothetical protein